MATSILLTDKIQNFIDSAISEGVSEKLKQQLEKYCSQNCTEKSVPASLVIKVHKCVNDGQNKIYLHELLKGSDLYYEALKPPTRSPELVARLERLKTEQENREYQKMTKNVRVEAFGGSILSEIGKDLRSTKAQLIGVLNVVLTIVGSFVFGYMATYYVGKPIPYCIVTGFVLASIVAVADIYFFIKTEV
ncbi:transmembrane protein 199-like [Anneissia japonica]|uniref:transmembrane protein 199-like n=1 Tax=Anneissia japonica TaxID=1529436 RepID=UPI001425AEE4|nr:transmembrane protein 199-like [Anneissia japonica]